VVESSWDEQSRPWLWLAKEQEGNKKAAAQTSKPARGPWARAKVCCVSAAPAAVRVELRTC
jgi:hypothetical protein